MVYTLMETCLMSCNEDIGFLLLEKYVTFLSGLWDVNETFTSPSYVPEFKVNEGCFMPEPKIEVNETFPGHVREFEVNETFPGHVREFEVNETFPGHVPGDFRDHFLLGSKGSIVPDDVVIDFGPTVYPRIPVDLGPDPVNNDKETLVMLIIVCGIVFGGMFLWDYLDNWNSEKKEEEESMKEEESSKESSKKDEESSEEMSMSSESSLKRSDHRSGKKDNDHMMQRSSLYK